MPVKAIVAEVEGYKKRFTLVTSAVELTGLQMVELFAARFRQEDGFRDLKQRLGWEECRAWTQNPIDRTSQAQWVTMSLLRLLQFRLEASGEVDWWFRPPWNPDKDRPSVLDAERLMRRHRGEIQRGLSEWLGTEENSEGGPETGTQLVFRSQFRFQSPIPASPNSPPVERAVPRTIGASRKRRPSHRNGSKRSRRPATRRSASKILRRVPHT